MSTKTKTHQLNGAHTAGIFADLTVDGPILGTLVAVVDRARNLPNRKTIGKQDPYCAARLGKEAKKTTADVRGGQTPRWDQELRFTVHDSPDYYQLKVSVFTDDKKTELIGESWVDLKGIVVPGGGQGDVWQTLSCRGKYAGEVRVEITYYDTRPKPEKPASKPKPAASEQDSGSTRQKSPMKRRPLPSDPVTGEAPAAPAPDHSQTPPRAHGKRPSQQGFVPNQSPLQAVEYSTPPSTGGRHHRVDHYSPSPQSGVPQGYSTPPSRVDAQHQMHQPREPYETPTRRHEDRDYSSKMPVTPYDQADPRAQYSTLPEPYDMPTRDDRRQLPSLNEDDDVPPPPPAHRSRHNSGGHEIAQRNSFDTAAQKPTPPMPMRHDVLKSEAHRQSLPAYPGRPTFRAYEPPPPSQNPAQPNNAIAYEPPAPRHHSHDSVYDAHHRSMQPTVEDVPDSPTGRGAYSHGRSPREDPRYERAPSPAPLNLSHSPGAPSPYGMAPSPMHPSDYQQTNGHPASVSPLGDRDYTDSPGQMSYHSHSSQSQHHGRRGDAEPTQIQSSASYGLPALPPSLVPGMDPALSHDISERIYEERRQDSRYGAAPPPMATPPRGRHMSEPPVSHGPSAGSSPSYAPHSYDRRSGVTYSGGPEAPARHSDIFPNANQAQRHTIRRKSVSPAPPPAEENRRLSDVPFGPDSYDALNPSVSPPQEVASAPAYKDPDGKIILHDGREVDPSDHLPMDSWAPEPEPKPNQKQATPESRKRPSPAGAQPMPPSGRRPLRMARPQMARPQTMPAPPPSYVQPGEHHTPPAPSSGGRNRLQKRAHRTSAAPSPSGPSPLAPISPDNYQDRNSPYTTPNRAPPRRANGWDYPNENHAPPHHGSGPPIPAKIPLPVMSGANGGPSDQMLMEEMQRIDIGAGRSRRRGGY